MSVEITKPPKVILKFAVKREQSQAWLGMPSVSKLNKVNFSSESGRGRGKVKARGEMQKRVQHDRLCYIEEHRIKRKIGPFVPLSKKKKNLR